MSFYPWDSPDQSEGSISSERLANQVTRRLGMTGYSEPARMKGAIAELLAGGAKLYDPSSAKYHGIPDDSTDNADAILAAIYDLEHQSTRGGVLFIPAGTWLTSQAVAITPTGSKTILITGEGKRSSFLYPITPGQTGIRLGSDTPDLSGTTSVNIRYCGIENLSVVGSLLLTGDAIGVQITQGQRCWMRNVLIEALPASSIGLYLRGSTTSGVHAAAAPHCWRCKFDLIDVATTRRPLVIENGDENDFFGSNFGCLTGITAAADSVRAVDIIQGHNNHFYGTLLSGDVTTPDGGSTYTYRDSYAGMYLRDPTKGDVVGLFAYGGVAEGFNHTVYLASSSVVGVRVMGWNASISKYVFYNGSDDGATNLERANNVKIETEGTDHISYATTRAPYTEPLTFAADDATPSVKGANAFAAPGTGSGPYTNFDDGHPGQVISVRLNTSYGITHGSSTVRCPGAGNISAANHTLVTMLNIGGVWQVLSVSVNA